MKLKSVKILLGAALSLTVSPAFADSVIVLRDGVRSLSPTLVQSLAGYNYKVKNAWKSSSSLVPQSLPQDPWQKARWSPNMAILVKGDFQSFLSFPEVKSIEENVPYSHEEIMREPPFDPVKCDGIIYGFHHYSETTQRLETSKSCDNFALRAKAQYTYRVEVISNSKKVVEAYEHGDLIASGEKELTLNYHYGYRQKYLIVRGEPGEYTLRIYPKNVDTSKTPLNDFVFSDYFSNAYGYGIPSSEKFVSDSAPQSEWIGPNMMGAERLWQKGITGKGITVAVIDTGIDVEHPFLKDAVVDGIEMFKGGTKPSDYDDNEGHGTHVAGIVHQVAPDAKLFAVRVFNEDADAPHSAVGAGIRWAVEHGANVINLSLGGLSNPKGWEDVFKWAASKGVIFAIASGNNTGFEPLFPAAFAGTVPGLGFAVGAADELGNMAVFSNWAGNNLDMKMVTSYGVRVLSAKDHSDGFVALSGTSMASPHIAGYLALMKQAYPKMSNAEIVEFVSKNVKRASVND